MYIFNNTNESNFDSLMTEMQSQNFQYNNNEDNNELKVNDYSYKNYLKPKDKIDKVADIILGIQYIFFIYIVEDQNSINNKYKIIFRDKNFFKLGEIYLNGIIDSISEIIEDKNYIIISQNNNSYEVIDFKTLKLIDNLKNMKINLILQIKTNEYIISKNNGIFKYKGPNKN